MGLLDKYARKTQGESKDKSVGSRIESSIYTDWIALCDRLGLKSAEAIRYLIIEELNRDKGKSVNDGKREITDNNNTSSSVISSLSNDNDVLTNVNFKTKKKRGKAGNMDAWTVNDRLPCPLCDPPRWITRTNYARHVKKHGFNTGYELIQANLDKVNQMVKEEYEQ
jgi:hypothetical protein